MRNLDAAFAQFMKDATMPRPGTMRAGEQAACLWWASLSPLERELVHGAGEARGTLRKQTPAECETQKERVKSAKCVADLTDSDLLWMLAVDLGKHGLTMSTPGSIVAHLRSRVDEGKTS